MSGFVPDSRTANLTMAVQHYYCSSRAIMLLLGALIDAPITKQTVPSLDTVLLSDAYIIEFEQPPQSLCEQCLVVRLRELRNKSACTLLYSCTTLLHSHTRILTTPRAALYSCTTLLHSRTRTLYYRLIMLCAHKILIPIPRLHWNRSAFEFVLKSHEYFQTSILIGLPILGTC